MTNHESAVFEMKIFKPTYSYIKLRSPNAASAYFLGPQFEQP